MASKTNALRKLDQHRINYEVCVYEVDEDDLSGNHVVEVLNQKANEVYKTLVLQGDRKGYIVCCIPVNEELDLKKVAKCTNYKKVEMIAMKDLLAITGYIRGGCSPVGMKKQFPTYFQRDILNLDKVYLSAGKRGMQMVVSPNDIISLVNGKTEDLIKC